MNRPIRWGIGVSAIAIVPIAIAGLVTVLPGVLPVEGFYLNEWLASLDNTALPMAVQMAPLRWMAYAMLVWHWPAIVSNYAARRSLSDEVVSDLAQARWAVCRITMAVEVLLNLGILSHAIDWAR